MMWLRCSACKRDIGFGAVHWVCSVSTCNRRNTDYKFCSVACWDSHVATLRHRDAWAVEERAPSREAWAQAERAAATPQPAPTAAPRSLSTATPQHVVTGGAPAPASASVDGQRRVVATPSAAPSTTGPNQLRLAEAERDILIVVSKMKKYIKDRSGFNCSDAVAEVLSDHVRAICDDSIRAAAMDERKTVLDRDVPKPRR
jgi:hypothetical protein